MDDCDDCDDNYIEIVKVYAFKNKECKIEVLEHENDKLREKLDFYEKANTELAEMLYELKYNNNNNIN